MQEKHKNDCFSVWFIVSVLWNLKVNFEGIFFYLFCEEGEGEYFDKLWLAFGTAPLTEAAGVCLFFVEWTA